MRFILMMRGAMPGAGEGIMAWPKETIQAHIEFMGRFNDALKREGVLVDAQGLDYPPKPKIVRASTDGQVVVTDGPFIETKEHLFGYWIVKVDNAGQAYAIAARASAAPGPGGLPINMPIEVRQVMDGPQID